MFIICSHLNNQPESDTEDEEEEDKISPEEVDRPLPVSKDGLNFEALIRNKTELEHFQNFLENRHKQGIGKQPDVLDSTYPFSAKSLTSFRLLLVLTVQGATF